MSERLGIDADGRGVAVIALPARWPILRALVRPFRFALVGATGIAVNQLVLWLGVELAGLHYALAAVVATQCSTTWNFGLNERFVFPYEQRRPLWLRFVAFAGVNNAALVVRVPLLAVLTSGLGINYLLSNLLTLVALFVARYAISDRLIWRCPR
jgi:dolichol-phosphate mannosyltransferase